MDVSELNLLALKSVILWLAQGLELKICLRLNKINHVL